MKPTTAKIRWVGARQPQRPYLAQIISDDGKTVETLTEHETEVLALKAARAEIAKRLRKDPP